MNKGVLLTLSGIILNFTIFSQKNDPVLLKINDIEVRKSEFDYIFHKNNKDTVHSEEAIREYLELFINFKLKVTEARNLGFDTTASFIQEIQNYKRQLSAPYLLDKETQEKLIREAYDRKKYRLRVSHILIKVSEDAIPSDTLKAYNKAMDIYKKLMAGESFEKLAQEYSEDENTKNKGGDIGFITALSTVYPFENAVYSMNVGEISKPVRSQYGYHIIKLVDKQLNPGDVKVAHILILEPRDASDEDKAKAKQKIEEAYNKLMEGKDFKDVALEYSDDKASARRGGDLPWFGTGKMIPEFENVCFSLKKDEISKPFKTVFGWHIVKKIDERPYGSFETEKNDLMNKLSKDNRSQLAKKALIEKLKKEYKYSFNNKNFDLILQNIDTNIFSGSWELPARINSNLVIFTLGDSAYTIGKFSNELKNLKTKKVTNKTNEYAKEFVKNYYKQWEENKIIEYETANLERKYPDYANLVKEYTEGILLFDITDKMVWSKAIKDTIGLKEFYEKNKNNYMWGERFRVAIISYENEKCKDQLIKEWNKTKNAQKIQDILNKINKKITCLTYKDIKIISKNDIPEIDELFDMPEYPSYLVKEKSRIVYLIIEKLKPQPKELSEIKGIVTADYQTFLEKQWIDELRKKYKIQINEEVLK